MVSLGVILAVLGSFARAHDDATSRLSLGLVLGVVAQIVLGGVTVKFHLWPPLVIGHFILSMILVCNAVVLHHRAGRRDDHIASQPTVQARRLGAILVSLTLLSS